MKTLVFWLNAARKTALPQSVIPAILALCMAVKADSFSLPLALLAVVGVAAAHLGMNLFDDYFDYRKKGSVAIREELAGAGFRARLGKCNFILSGEATARHYLVAACTFCGVAVVLGDIIAYYQGVEVFWYVLIGGFLGIFYSGYPIRFSYYGLGEVLIGIMFGPLLMSGVYYAATGTQDLAVWWVSVAVGLLVANIVYTHAVMDYEPDKGIGKMTLAVLIGGKRGMMAASALLTFLPYVVMVTGVVWSVLPVSFLLTLLTLPMAVGLFRRMRLFTRDERTESLTPRFWMGPMENWELIRTAGIDWFMIRWMLSRNLLSIFCLIILILSFLPYTYIQVISHG
ncbi:MAG: prenyltransferase [Prevotellaceae bacterium]|jgi:1,4-dihydroxy-2-naphthoate octaprenyltransferase|nr:prenyltransferase [Prevotellaceae bacterium]